ncbi:MAG: dihydropteroate synthase [Cytophagales bacterium]
MDFFSIRLPSGELIDLTHPVVMGVINITPDSFFSESRIMMIDSVLKKAEQFLKEGAVLIDVGGFSSRPNADWISEEEEAKRVFPVIEALKNEFKELVISIDTFRSGIAKGALERGVSMVNDISGGKLDSEMFQVLASHKSPYVLMHMRGTPQNMQELTHYEHFLAEVVQELQNQVLKARNVGVVDIIIDPGFGFAKTMDQNYVLLKNLNYLGILNCPLLVGLSRKSMAYKLLGISPEEALNATTVLNTLALNQGAKILRVHDVKEAKQCIEIWKKTFEA